MIKEITKVHTERSFSAAHRLPNHPGKCKYLHGHTWRIVVDISAPVSENDMIADFGDIKAILDEYDHDYLNEPQRGQKPIENPTAENLASMFAYKLAKLFDKPLTCFEEIVVKVYESTESFAEVVLTDTNS